MQKNKSIAMMPIAPLMIEHRLIGRMVKLMKGELERVGEGNTVNLSFVDTAADFLRTYVDECHHGKEEAILFSHLSKKKLSLEHARLLQELMDDHVFGRNIVSKMVDAKQRYSLGDTQAEHEIVDHLRNLTEFYPLHVDKEDRNFFVPSMEYFDKGEKNAMLHDSWEFDRKMIHKKYQEIVKQLEDHTSKS